jgi:formamidopyrimidine-DNA glycosylase
MPELPEVETIRRGLEKRIVGKTITDLSFDWPKGFLGKKEDVVSREVERVERRAKVLRIKLGGDYNLLFHLKMTGQLIYRAAQLRQGFAGPRNQNFSGGHPSHDWHDKLPNSTTRIVFTFNDNSKLFFNDLRKFGWCKVLKDEEIVKIFGDDYGLEPFDSKSGQVSAEFTPEYLMLKAKSIPNRTIKQFLMDQTIIAGVGNIYADEALFDVKIMPTRKVKDISLSDWKKLIQSVIKILELGIAHGGTTDSDYVNVDGKNGGMQDYLKVYHKAGQKCSSNCGGTIERMTVGGRGTHYCGKCQK